jgi:hypothetical protein
MIGFDLNKIAQELGQKNVDVKFSKIVEEHNFTLSAIKTPKTKVFQDLFFNDTFLNEDTASLAKIIFETIRKNHDFKLYINLIFGRQIKDMTDAEEFTRFILTATPSQLEDIKKKVDDYQGISCSEIVKEIFSYDKLQTKIASFYKEYSPNTCIFCNRNYTTNFEKNSDDSTVYKSFTLDHFLQKGKYPILSLSLFNLLPTCYTCNSTVKNQRDVNQYMNPHSSNYEFHKLATFNITDIKSYEFQLESNDEACNKYIADFYINKIYKSHQSISDELIMKSKVYSKERIAVMAKKLKISEEELTKGIYGETKTPNNFADESLSKFKYDILKYLDII